MPSVVEVQGHRGYGDLEPHNTLRAFRAAASDSVVQSVEFDVRRSADGHLVVTHGPEVGPIVDQATLAELQATDLGHGERVPLLSEVVDACLEGGLIMNVELKGGESMQNVSDTIVLLRDKGALSSCRISSFDRDMLKKVIEISPETPVGALYNGTASFIDAADKSRGVIFHDPPADFASWFATHRVEGDSVNLRAEALIRSPNLMEEARKCGKRVMAWFPCVPNPGFEDGLETYRRLIDLGVDVICCNRPDLLRQLLAQASAEPGAGGAVAAPTA